MISPKKLNFLKISKNGAQTFLIFRPGLDVITGSWKFPAYFTGSWKCLGRLLGHEYTNFSGHFTGSWKFWEQFTGFTVNILVHFNGSWNILRQFTWSWKNYTPSYRVKKFLSISQKSDPVDVSLIFRANFISEFIPGNLNFWLLEICLFGRMFFISIFL